MSRSTNRTHVPSCLAIALAAMVLVGVGMHAQAGPRNVNPAVLPPQSTLGDLTYGQWSTLWWKWALSIPADQNPMLDDTGANAAIGQTGSVWFLAGNWGANGVVTRNVTIPSGKALFFPIYNYIYVNTPQFGDPEWSADWEEELRDLAAASVDAGIAGGISCEIDGRPVKDLASYRCPTDTGGAFMVSLPENNVFAIPADDYGPSVSDGVFLMVAPLSRGVHTIHFAAGTMEVTYKLTVGP